LSGLIFGGGEFGSTINGTPKSAKATYTMIVQRFNDISD
jgi:hypothetical protein